MTGPPGDHGALHRHRNASATTQRFISPPPRGVLQRLEEQSGSGCGESGGFEGQSQYHRLQRRSSPCSPVTVFPRFDHRLHALSQFAHAARTLVRGGPTRPHRPRLVASHSTRPPSSPPLPAHSFYIGPAVINIHTGRAGLRNLERPRAPPGGVNHGGDSASTPWGGGVVISHR